MAAKPRHREYHKPEVHTGTLWVYLGPTTTTRTKSSLTDGWCDDTVGGHDQANGLTLRKVWTRVHLLNGEEWYTNAQGVRTLLAKYTGCPSYWTPSPKSGTSKWALPTESDLLAKAPTIVAKTNPSAPHVGVPTFLGELRDVPGSVMDPLIGFQKLKNIVPTVRNWGLMLLRGVAAGYISWRWAIKPMIHDIRCMLEFKEAVDRRLMLLRSLMTGKVCSKKCDMGTIEDSLTEQVTVESQRATLIRYRDTYFRKREWASVKWRMNEITSRYWNEQLKYDDQALVKHTKKLVLGATSQEALAVLWELTPWSWFADWFGTIGDTIQACNNSSGCYPVEICLMRETWTKSTYRTKTSSSWLQFFNEPQEQEVEKRRFLVPLVGYHIPSFTLPILQGKQWAILGALAALKGTPPFKAGTRAFHRYEVTLKGGRRAVIRERKVGIPPRVNPEAVKQRRWAYVRRESTKPHYTKYTRKGRMNM